MLNEPFLRNKDLVLSGLKYWSATPKLFLVQFLNHSEYHYVILQSILLVLQQEPVQLQKLEELIPKQT